MDKKSWQEWTALRIRSCKREYQRVRDVDLVVFAVTVKGIGFVATNRRGTRGWVFFTSLDYVPHEAVCFHLRISRRCERANIYTRERWHREFVRNEEEQTRSCVSIASERLHARDALSKPGLCNFAICLANARTHAFTQLREAHVLFYDTQTIIIFRYFILIMIFIFNLTIAICLIFSIF